MLISLKKDYNKICKQIKKLWYLQHFLNITYVNKLVHYVN